MFLLRSALCRSTRIAGAFALLALLSTSALPVLAQGVESAVRVMAIDAGNGDITLLDPESGEVVGRFTTPTGGFAAVYPSGNGRYLLANHYAGNHVTIVDSGLSLQEHGDHADLVTAPPFVLGTVATVATPAHYWAHDGLIAVHNDGDGTVTIFDESEIAEAIDPFTFPIAQPDHTSVAVINDTLLAGYYDLGRVDAYGVDGRLIQEGVGDCPGAHGEAKFAETIVFACSDGLLLVTPVGDGFRAQKVAYPETATSADADAEATPTADAEAPRVGSIAAHEDNPVLVGDFGEGLALITPSADGVTIDIVPLPASPLGFAYDQQGERLAVLTDDGAMHGVDPARGEILWSSPAVTPYTEIELGDGFDFYPSLAASDEAAYVADPKTGEVVELNLESGEVTNRFAVGGQPARIALVQASGADH
jgi:hypothetical protein